MKMTKNIFVFFLSAILLLFAGCEKDYLDTKPSDKVTTSTLFETYDGALAALNGTYRIFYATGIETSNNHNEFGQKAIDLTLDLMGEDMAIWSQGYGWFTDSYGYNIHSATKGKTEYMWDHYYNLVNNSNEIINNIEAIDASTEKVNYVKGQALAIRAYAYFYLVRLYQHTYVGHENAPAVPLYTESTNIGKPRATVKEVYNQIESDLNESINLLGNTMARIHKSHINQSVAQGIMARVKLNKEEWSEAVTYAQNARADYSLMSQAKYQPNPNGKNGFNNLENPEWMWGFQINSEQTTYYASFLSHFDPLASSYASFGLQKLMFSELYSQIPNPSSDVRATCFDETGSVTKPYGQLKFLFSDAGAFLGDYLMMRASEMYLIEAEAQAELGNYTEAQNTLFDLVSQRDPNYTKPTETGASLLDEIYLQRRISLWGEGFRLLDLKRRKQPLDRTGGNHKTSLAVEMQLPAESDQFIFQIPEEELDANDEIGPGNQNP